MKARAFAVLALLLVCGMSAAQNYQIQVGRNTNLRAGHGLDSRIVETARAGSVLHVTGSVGDWLRIIRQGKQVWMANWVRHSRVQDGASAAAEPQAQVDNCCFVDRECVTDQDWTDGFYAYQHHQCAATAGSLTGSAAPAQPQTPTQTGASAAAASKAGQIDNCCFAGWDCQTDDEWRAGYMAYQNSECPVGSAASSRPVPPDIDNCCWVNRNCVTDEDWARGHAAYLHFQCRADVPVSIQGSDSFVALMNWAFNLLRERAPRLYAYGISGLKVIRMVPPGSAEGIYIESKTYVSAWSPAQIPDEWNAVREAGDIVHEACHAHRWDAGQRERGWRGELPCLHVQLEALMAVDPGNRTGLADWIRVLIANIRDANYHWW